MRFPFKGSFLFLAAVRFEKNKSHGLRIIIRKVKGKSPFRYGGQRLR